MNRHKTELAKGTTKNCCSIHPLSKIETNSQSGISRRLAEPLDGIGKVRVGKRLLATNFRLFVVVVLTLSCYLESVPLLAQLPTAELNGLSKQVIPIGTPVELSLTGTRLDELSAVRLRDMQGVEVAAELTIRRSASQPLREDLDSTGAIELRIASLPESPSPGGLIELFSAGRFGVSNPRPLLVSPQPVDWPTGDYTSAATAYPMKTRHWINDRTPVRAANYYRVTVEPGQRLQCVAYSKQLDSLAVLSLRLLDSKGDSLASSRSLGMWPAELSWTNAQAEKVELVIQIHDLLYRGGEGYHFVLEAVTGDNQDNAAPLQLDQLLRPSLTLPMTPARFSQPLSADLLQSPWSEFPASDANSVAALPLKVRGDFNSANSIRFHAEKGQQLRVQIHSASIDQLTDPAIVLYKVVAPAAGDQAAQETLQQVLEQDDLPALGTAAVKVRRIDPQLVWSVPENATYQLQLIDRQTGTRPADARGFLLEVSMAQPDFTLVAHQPFPTNNPAVSKPWGLLLQRNGTAQIHVSILRRDGFSGAVELSLEGLPDSCRCTPVVVPPSSTEADLVIQCAADAVDAIFSAKVVGTTTVGEQTVKREAGITTITAAATPAYNTVQSRRSSSLIIAVQSLDIAPLQVQLGLGEKLMAKAGTKLTLPVKLLRQAGSAAECTLRPQALPPKVGLGEFKIAGDAAEAAPEIDIAADAAPGEYTFWLQTETKVKYAANPQALTREQAYLEKLKAAIESNALGETPRTQIDAAIAQSTARIEELKKSTAEAEYTLFLPSNQIRLQILPKD